MFGIPPTELAIVLIVSILLFFDWPLPPAGGANARK
jgi:Sec-independent protein translocase protein TatA